MTDFTAPAAPVAQEVRHLRMAIDYLVVVTPEVPEVPAVLDDEGEEVSPAIPAVPESKELIRKGSFRCEVPFSDGCPDKIVQEDAMKLLSATEKGQIQAIMDKRWPKAYAMGDDLEPITT